MAILVLNHLHLSSAVELAPGAVLSAAEMLVAVSGVVVGIVFGRRWVEAGARQTTLLLLRRARKLYLASVAVVAIVAGLTLVPGLATEFLSVSPTMDPPQDSYDQGGAAGLALAIVTLEAGPWQFNVLGFFVAALAIAPLALWALDRGRWPLVVLAGLALFVIGRELHPEVLPSQSERPFPFLIWQLLFVGGIVIGWHRRRLGEALRAWRRPLLAGLLLAAGLAAAGLIGLQLALGPDRFADWERAHLDKGTLAPARIAVMMLLTGAVYVLFRRWQAQLVPTAGRLLLPLGRNSFYVFIMHVFVCLALASLPLAAGGYGPLGNSAIELACLAALWLMADRGFLFRWVPR